MSRVSIKPELLLWARERAGETLDSLRKSFPRYDRWERAEELPTLKQLERFAKKTSTPLGYFFLSEPPNEELPIPDFRTLGDVSVGRPSPDLLETIQLMQRRQAWMRELAVEQGQDRLRFVGSVTRRQSSTTVAREMRLILGLTNGWAGIRGNWEVALKAVRESIEDAGILVVFNGVVENNTRRTLDVDEFRGFVLIDEYAPLIFVNAADAPAAQMFTLVHELAHLWLGRTGVINLKNMLPVDNAVEAFCNRVAAEFLIPEIELKEIWSVARTFDDPFKWLAKRFKVSPLVSARRALDLGLVDKPAFFSYYHDYMEKMRQRKKGKASGGDFYANQNNRVGRRFGEAIVRSAREGRILYREAYALTGLHGKTFDRYAIELGIQR